MKEDFKVGDKVRITLPSQDQVVGHILSVNHWGDDGWYIELTRLDGGYGYWKQGIDGGTVVKVK